MPWNDNALKVALENHMNHKIVWVSKIAKILPISSYDAKGGYRKVRKYVYVA